MARTIAVKKATREATKKTVVRPVGEAKPKVTAVKKETRKATETPVSSPAKKAKPNARSPSKPTAEPVLTTLKAAMTGRASPAKAKEGDEPVFAYIRSLPQPQRGIAERVDALAAKTLPALKRSVK